MELGIPGLEDISEVARGGAGVVYRAREPEFGGREVAVKVIADDNVDEEALRRFRQECMALGRVAWHPHVVAVYRAGETTDHRPYLVMDYLPHGSLADRLDQSGAMDWGEATDVIVKIAGALETAHRADLLHRDIKPANILVDRLGEPRLADFGVARVEGETRTRTGIIAGTIAHMAPETLESGQVTVRSDVYALGSTLFELVAGAPAFDTRKLSALISQISEGEVPDLREHGAPDEVWEVVESCMRPAGDRPATAQAVGEMLRGAQTELAILPTPLLVPDDTEPEPPAQAPRRDHADTVAPRLPPSDRSDVEAAADSPKPDDGGRLAQPSRTPVALVREPPVLELVEAARALAAAFDRDDLAARLDEVGAALTGQEVPILVIGDFKQGKSSLVNALVGRRVCPVDADVATSVPTLVSYGAEDQAWVHSIDGGEQAADPIGFDEVAAVITAAPAAGGARITTSVDIQLPAEVLAGGVVLVDTPGQGGLDSAAARVGRADLATAGAALFVTDASQELTAAELEYLRHAADQGAEIALVLTKTDLYPEWRTIADLDRKHLVRAKVAAEVWPTSSTLMALSVDDETLEAESGIPALATHLADEVAGRARAAGTRRGLDEARSVVAQLRAEVLADEEAADPERSAAVVADLEAAHKAAHWLASAEADWLRDLADEIGDLDTDLEHDLQRRLGETLADAQVRLEEGDPAKLWSEFEPILTRSVTEAVAEVYVMLSSHAAELGEQTSQSIKAAQKDALSSDDIDAPTAALEALRLDPTLDRRSDRQGSKGMAVLHASWGGVEPMLAVGSLVGLGGVSLLNPLVLVAGLTGMLAGRFALRHERRRQVAERQIQALEQVRQYLQEVHQQVETDLDHAVRHVHREIREGGIAAARALEQSTLHALEAAREAADEDEDEPADRDSAGVRAQEIDALEQRLVDLADELAP